MLRIIIYLMIIVFLSTCVDLKKRNKDADSKEKFVEVNNKEALNEQIIISLKQLIEDLSLQINPDTIKNICYTVEFYNESWNPEMCYEKDTIILVSYYSSIGNYAGYRGVLIKDDYLIAIIDKNNIGVCFYDENALDERKLDELKCVNLQNQLVPKRLARMLKLKEGKLREMHGGIFP